MRIKPYSVTMHDNKEIVDTRNQETFDEVMCGYGRCKPEGLQWFNRPTVLLIAMCLFTFTQGFVVNGVNHVNTQAIERRFSLPSSRSGLMASAYDFSAAVFGVVISFIGSGQYKARWLATAAIIMSMGSFIMTIPHFANGLYEWGQGESLKTCQRGANVTKTGCEASGLQNYLGVLMLGMILHGIGGCILYTVGVGLIDDSVEAVKSPLYLGILYGAAALGPGVGYIVGGQFLNIYVDFNRIDTSTISLKNDDPRWVGAWWASFFVSMTGFILVAIPLSCFGSEMPTAQTVRAHRQTQMHKGHTSADGAHGRHKRLPIKVFPKVTWSLLKNPTFLFTILAGAAEGILTSGFATFVPKYIQNVFGVSSGLAAFYTGAAAVPGAAGGMFFGGFICNRLKLKVKGMLKFSIITCLLTVAAVNILWISCDIGDFAGVNKEYEDGGQTNKVNSACNSGCNCTTRYFDPVCSGGKIQYFSACYAGCHKSSNDAKTYSDCSCVSPAPALNNTVTSGPCSSGCPVMYLFLVLFFVTIFLTFLPGTPSDSATLRCIHEDHRTFSMGLKWMVIRLLGTVPGPVIFGAVTDTACLVWQEECGKPTSCWIYDHSAVSRNYFLVAISVKFLSMIFFLIAFCLYKPPDETEHKQFDKRESFKRQMSFVNGSFRASEYEDGVVCSMHESSELERCDKTTTL